MKAQDKSWEMQKGTMRVPEGRHLSLMITIRDMFLVKSKCRAFGVVPPGLGDYFIYSQDFVLGSHVPCLRH